MTITIHMTCPECDTIEVEEIDDEGRFYFFTPTFIMDNELCNFCEGN